MADAKLIEVLKCFDELCKYFTPKMLFGVITFLVKMELLHISSFSNHQFRNTNTHICHIQTIQQSVAEVLFL